MKRHLSPCFYCRKYWTVSEERGVQGRVWTYSLSTLEATSTTQWSLSSWMPWQQLPRRGESTILSEQSEPICWSQRWGLSVYIFLVPGRPPVRGQVVNLLLDVYILYFVILASVSGLPHSHAWTIKKSGKKPGLKHHTMWM